MSCFPLCASTSLTGKVLELYVQKRAVSALDAKIKVLASIVLAIVCVVTSVLDLTALVFITISIIPLVHVGLKNHFTNIIATIVMLFRSFGIPFGAIPTTIDRPFWWSDSEEKQAYRKGVEKALGQYKNLYVGKYMSFQDESEGNSFLHIDVSDQLKSSVGYGLDLSIIEVLNSQMLDINLLNKKGYSAADYFFSGVPLYFGSRWNFDNFDDPQHLCYLTAKALAKGSGIDNVGGYVSFLTSAKTHYDIWKKVHFESKDYNDPSKRQVRYPIYLKETHVLPESEKNNRYIKLFLDVLDGMSTKAIGIWIDLLLKRATSLLTREAGLKKERFEYLKNLSIAKVAKELLNPKGTRVHPLPDTISSLILEYSAFGLADSNPKKPVG